MINLADTISFLGFDLWYTRNVSQATGWAKSTSIFHHRYNLIIGWLVNWAFQKCLRAFVYLQWFFRRRGSQEVSTHQYISSEVRQDLFLQLHDPTYDTSIWYLHRSHTCAQGKNSPIVARHKAKSSQQCRLVYDSKNLQILHLMLIMICRLLL